MKCLEFENGLHDPATPSSWREQALAHAAECLSCERRWAAHQAVDTRLREFALATDQASASPRVRATLRAAVAGQQVSAKASAEVLPFPSREQRSRRVVRLGGLAAAAMLLLAFALSFSFWALRSAPSEKEFGQLRTENAPSLLPLPPREPLPAPVVTAVAERRGSTKSKQKPGKVAASPEQEAEFIPLTLAADEQAIANGALVRMEMSRARLIALGLPLPYEASRDTLETEVIVGDNGVAYAIRIVPSSTIASASTTTTNSAANPAKGWNR